MSGDGSTVFGYCSNSTTSQRFRRTQGTGMVFVGYSRHVGSETNEAFRAVLPEPATALLLAPMAMLLRTRRRPRDAR